MRKNLEIEKKLRKLKLNDIMTKPNSIHLSQGSILNYLVIKGID